MSNPNPERDERVEVPKQIWMTVFTDDKDPRFILADWRTPDVRNTQPGDYVAIRPHHKAEYVPVEAVNDAATRMRDRCVQELKNLIDAEQNKHPSAHVAVRRMALHDAITELQSLTLDQAEQKQ